MSISKLLSLNNSTLLYRPDPNLLEQFKTISSYYNRVMLDSIPNAHEKLNIFITVCDIWVALHTYKNTILLDEIKCMSFPPAAIQLKLLEENNNLKQYITHANLSPEQTFILAYFISLTLMEWIQNIMKQEKRFDLVNYYKDEMVYFELFELKDEDSFFVEMINQTVFVKAMMRNLRETNDFNFAVQSAISKTKDFLKGLVQ